MKRLPVPSTEAATIGVGIGIYEKEREKAPISNQARFLHRPITPRIKGNGQGKRKKNEDKDKIKTQMSHGWGR